MPELERLPTVHRRHVFAGEGQGAGIVFALEVTAMGEWERDDVCPGRLLDPHIGLAAPAEHVLFPQLLAQLTRLILGRSVCEADALAEIFARVPLLGRVLDLGTGTGTLAKGYRERGAETVALDLSLPMLRAAQSASARVAARAEALPFPAEVFDAVTAGQCWHWFDATAASMSACSCVQAERWSSPISTTWRIDPVWPSRPRS